MKEKIRQLKETIELRSSALHRFRGHRYFPFVLLAACFLTGSCVHIWQRVKVMALVKEVGLLKKENAVLQDEKKKIYSDVTSLSTSARIERFATDTLGLEPIAADRLLTLVRSRNEKAAPAPDKLATMYSAIKRVADYLPVVEETRANAGAIEQIRIDSVADGRRP